jgi:hypothetical protein
MKTRRQQGRPAGRAAQCSAVRPHVIRAKSAICAGYSTAIRSTKIVKQDVRCHGVVCVHYTGMLSIKRQKHSAALCIRYKHPHRAANKRSENKHPKRMKKLLHTGRLQHLVSHVTRPTLCRISTACSTSNAAPSPNVHALAVTGLIL